LIVSEKKHNHLREEMKKLPEKAYKSQSGETPGKKRNLPQGRKEARGNPASSG